jgi:hypothetical protein
MPHRFKESVDLIIAWIFEYPALPSFFRTGVTLTGCSADYFRGADSAAMGTRFFGAYFSSFT